MRVCDVVNQVAIERKTLGGRVDDSELPPLRSTAADPLGISMLERRKEYAEYVAKCLAKPGDVPALTPLLEHRRLDFAIPNGAFETSDALFRRVNVWPIALPSDVKETYGDSRIIKTDRAQKVEEQDTSRGIILSAGAKALDILRSNGVDIGQIIYFTRLAIYGITVDWVGGKPKRIKMLDVGEITDAEDVLFARRAGRVRMGGEPHRHVLEALDLKGSVIATEQPQDSDPPSDI
jgi:hypothetical protein